MYSAKNFNLVGFAVFLGVMLAIPISMIVMGKFCVCRILSLLYLILRFSLTAYLTKYLTGDS